jgi:hypothetical protein
MSDVRRSYDTNSCGAASDVWAPRADVSSYPRGTYQGMRQQEFFSGTVGFTEAPKDWVFETELTHLLRQAMQEKPRTDAVHDTAPVVSKPARRRRARERRPPSHWIPLLRSVAIASVTALTSVLGAMIAYAALSHLVAPTARHPACWWPAVIYGPWLAVALCVLRPPLRRHGHTWIAWALLLAFSDLAVTLCVTPALMTPAGIMTAALPPVAALACIHLLTLSTRPLHARPSAPGFMRQ